jgi:hypothetical protein
MVAMCKYTGIIFQRQKPSGFTYISSSGGYSSNGGLNYSGGSQPSYSGISGVTSTSAVITLSGSVSGLYN